MTDDPGLTELKVAMFDAWARAAGDPYETLLRWPREGAPAGLDEELEDAGIFPQSHEPPSKEFELRWYEGDHINYQSMEESKDGLEVLMGLARSGYIKRFITIKGS